MMTEHTLEARVAELEAKLAAATTVVRECERRFAGHGTTTEGQFRVMVEAAVAALAGRVSE